MIAHEFIWLPNQIKQWEEIDPDDIDQVPVEPDDIHRSVVIARKIAAFRSMTNPEQNADADCNVNTVQAGHHEVKTKKYELVAGRILRIREEAARQESVVKLVGVLDVFDEQEHERAKNRDVEIS